MSVGADLAGQSAAVILAGGKGKRLAPLTRETCKPALPFGGAFRAIDFSLANCANSGVRSVGVAVRYKPEALLAHLADTWNGHASVWRAEERAQRTGCGGTADAVYRNLARIAELSPRLVLVLCGDHVYKMDYGPLMAAHVAAGADATVACVDVPLADAHRYGVLAVGHDARIERFLEKPRTSAELSSVAGSRALVSMGVYVFDAEFLSRIVKRDACDPRSHHDFAVDVLPRLVDNSRLFAFPFRAAGSSTRAYWRDIGTLRSYWRAHMELLEPTPPLTLDDPSWPIRPAAACSHSVAPRSVAGTDRKIEQSIVRDIGAIRGRITRSVLSGGVLVADGATITESVLLPGAVIGARSRLRGVIVDAGFHVPAATVIERDAVATGPLVLSLDAGGTTVNACGAPPPGRAQWPQLPERPR